MPFFTALSVIILQYMFIILPAIIPSYAYHPYMHPSQPGTWGQDGLQDHRRPTRSLRLSDVQRISFQLSHVIYIILL